MQTIPRADAFRLICDFMGFEKQETKGEGTEFEYYKIGTGSLYNQDIFNTCSIDYMCFDSSFDWLIPVVDKIETLPMANVIILNGKCRIQQWDVTDMDILYVKVTEAPRKIDALFAGVVEFIQWHNDITRK